MKTRMHLLAILLTATSCALPAAGFDYDEAVQGDIDINGNNGSLHLFQLNVGTNVIRGSTFLTSAGGDSDAFRFKLPPGTALDLSSIVYHYEVTDVFGGVHASGPSFFVGDGLSDSMPLYGTAFPDVFPSGENFWLFSDGTIPDTEVTASPVTLPFFQVVDSQVNLDFPAAPLDPGIYWFSNGARGFSTGEFGTSWDYTITIIVAPAS